jgi:hypothetical protein
MSSPRPLPEAPEDIDWGTDALTGLIPPRDPRSRQAFRAAADVARATLPAPPPAPAVLPAALPVGRSPVSWASYALLVVLAVGASWVLARHLASSPEDSARRALDATSAASAASPDVRGAAKVEARTIQHPTPKAAAAAFARGDYREALAQYRGLSQLYPEQPAYASLIHILERRLAPKPSGE